VRAVANGLLALKALRDELFDCVLLEVLMPEMDGYQVLEYIRSDPELRHTPVITIPGSRHGERHPVHRDFPDGPRLLCRISVHAEPAHHLLRTQLVNK
jgi:CheY-like chemotaxis protein